MPHHYHTRPPITVRPIPVAPVSPVSLRAEMEAEPKSGWGRFKSGWSDFWDTGIGWTPPWADHQEDVQRTMEGLDPEIREQVSDPWLDTKLMLGMFPGGDSYFFEAVRGKSEQYKAMAEYDLSAEERKAVLFHDSLYSEHAQTRNLIAGAAVGTVAAVASAPYVAAGVGAVGLTGGAAFTVKALAGGLIAIAPEIVPGLIEAGSPYGSGGTEVSREEAAWGAVGLFGDLGVGAAIEGVRPLKQAIGPAVSSVTSPIGRGISGLFGKASSPVRNPLATKKNVEEAQRIIEEDYDWMIPESPSKVARVQEYEAFRDEMLDVQGTKNLSDVQFRGGDEFTVRRSGRDPIDMTWARLARTRMQRSFHYLPDLEETYPEEFESLAEGLTVKLYSERGGSAGRRMHEEYVLPKAKEIIRGEIPSESMLSLQESREQALKQWEQERALDQEQLENLKASGAYPEQVDIVQRRLEGALADQAESMREVQSLLYEHANERFVKSYESTLLKDATSTEAQLEAFTAGFKDLEAKDAFLKGLKNPDIGISSVMTPTGMYSGGNDFADFSGRFTGKPEAAFFDERFSGGADEFKAVINLQSNQHKMPHLLSWLRKSGLYVAGASGDTDRDIALHVTSDKNKENFWGVWEDLGLTKDVIESNAGELFGKRGGLLRVGDVVDVSDELPVMDDATNSFTFTFAGEEKVQIQLVDSIEEQKRVSVTGPSGGEEVMSVAEAAEKVVLEPGYSYTKLTPDGDIMASDYTDAGAVMGRSALRSFLRGIYSAHGQKGSLAPDVMSERDLDQYMDDLLSGGSFFFSMTGTLNKGFIKQDVRAVSDEHYQQIYESLVGAGRLRKAATVPDIIGSMASLKTKFDPDAQVNRLLFKPESKLRDTGNYRILNTMQESRWAESFLGEDLLREVTRESYQGMRQEGWRIAATMFDEVGPVELETVARSRARKSMFDKLTKYNQEGSFGEEYTKALEELMGEYSEESQLFMKKAMTRGMWGSSMFRLFGSSLNKAVYRGGRGKAPSGAMPGVMGRLLPEEFTAGAGPASRDHIKLVFDGDEFVGAAPHSDDAATWEFIRGLDTSDVDDHALMTLLHHRGGANEGYYMPLGRSPISPAAGLVRKVEDAQAEKFIESTGIKPIDVTNAKLNEGGNVVDWSFDVVKAGQSRYFGDARAAVDLPTESIDFPEVTDVGGMLRGIAKFNAEKGAIGILDPYMRLAVNSGIYGPKTGGVISEPLDAITRFKGTLNPAVDSIREDIAIKLETDPNFTLDKHTIEEYPWLQDHFEKWMAETRETIIAPQYEYKRVAQAEIAEEGIANLRLFDDIESILHIGSLTSVTKELPKGLLNIAEKATKQVSGLHNTYTGTQYKNRVGGKDVSAAQQEVLDTAFREAMSTGYIGQSNVEDFAAALMQVAVRESARGPRQGFESGVSGEIIRLLDPDVGAAYFENFDDFEPALRLQFGGGLTRAAKDPEKEYVVRRSNDPDDEAYHIGEILNNTFKSIQKVEDDVLGAVASKLGPLRYAGAVGSTVDAPDVPVSEMFRLKPLDAPEDASADELVSLWEQRIGGVADELQAERVSGINWTEQGRGREIPEGILNVSTQEVTESGMRLSVRGGMKEIIEPLDLREHVEQRGRRLLVFDVENTFEKLLRNGKKTNRERAQLGYWGGQIIDVDSGSVEHIELSLGEIREGRLKDIVASVSDVSGYNVWHDMDLSTRLFGTNFADKVVWDMQAAADTVGLGTRANIRQATQGREDELFPVSRDPKSRLQEAIDYPEGNVPRGTPLKGQPHAAAPLMGVGERQDFEVNALELTRAMMRKPADRRTKKAMAVYSALDVQDVTDLHNIFQVMNPETFGRFGDTNVAGKTWSDLNRRPFASYYHHQPDINDMRLQSGTGIPSLDFDPMESDIYSDYVSEARRQLREGEASKGRLKAQAWGEYAGRQGLAPGALTVVSRGMQEAGVQATRGVSKLIRGVGAGARGITAPLPEGIKDRVRNPRYARAAGQWGFWDKLRGETRTDVADIGRGGIGDYIIGSSDVGQSARIMQLPGVYTRSGLNMPMFAGSVALTGLQFTTGWMMGGRLLGKVWDSPAAMRRLAGTKESDLLMSEINLRLRQQGVDGVDEEDRVKGTLDIAKKLMSQERNLSSARLRSLRNFGSLNPYLRMLRDESQTQIAKDVGDDQTYDDFIQYLDQLDTDHSPETIELLRRETDDGVIQYGNLATEGIRTGAAKVSEKVRNIKGLSWATKRFRSDYLPILSEDPDKYTKRADELRYDIKRLRDLSDAQGFTHGGREKIADMALPFMRVTREMWDDPTIRRRFEERGQSFADARIDPELDLDILTGDERKQVFGRTLKREAFKDDLRTAKRVGRMQYSDTRLGRGGIGANISRIYGQTIGIESPLTRSANVPDINLGKGSIGSQLGRLGSQVTGLQLRDSHRLRMAGTIADPGEWRRAGNIRNWMPDRSVAKALLVGQAAMVGAAVGEGLWWEGRRVTELGGTFGEGYSSEDLWNSSEQRDSSRTQHESAPTTLRVGIVKALPVIGRLPIPRVGEWAMGPRRKYAEQENERIQYRGMNEEWSHAKRPWLMGPPDIHPWELQKLPLADPSRWKDLNLKFMSPFSGQKESFSQRLGKLNLRELDHTDIADYADVGRMDSEAWEAVRGGNMSAVGGAQLQKQLSSLRDDLGGDSEEWSNQLDAMQAFSRYVSQGASRASTESTLAKFVPQGVRRVTSQEAASRVREESLTFESHDAWTALQNSLRSLHGEAYKFPAGYSEKWASGEYQPITAKDHEYTPGQFGYGYVEMSQMAQTPKLNWWDQTRRYMGHLLGKPITTYVSPPKGQSGIFIPPPPREEEKDSLWDRLRNVFSEQRDLNVQKDRPQHRLWGGGLVPGQPGGVDVTLGDGATGEVVIPLDTNTIQRLFGMSGGESRSSEELLELATAVHDLARLMGGLESKLGEYTHEISATNKGAGEALRYVKDLQTAMERDGGAPADSTLSYTAVGAQQEIPVDRGLQWTQEVSPQDWQARLDRGRTELDMEILDPALEWDGTSDLAKRLSATTSGVTGLSDWQQVLTDKFSELESTLGMLWTPFTDPAGGRSQDWSAGFDETSGFTRIKESAVDAVTIRDVDLEQVYGADALNFVESQQAGVRRGGPRVNEFDFGGVNQIDPTLTYTVPGGPTQSLGQLAAMSPTDTVTLGKPADEVTPGGYVEETIVVGPSDIHFVDADTVKIRPETAFEEDPSAPGQAKLIDYDPDDAAKVEKYTEEFRLAGGINADEKFSPYGQAANVVTLGYLQARSREDRLQFDITGETAGGEDPGNPTARSMGEFFTATETGDRVPELKWQLAYHGLNKTQPVSAVDRLMVGIAEEEGVGLESDTARRIGLERTADTHEYQGTIKEQELRAELGAPTDVMQDKFVETLSPKLQNILAGRATGDYSGEDKAAGMDLAPLVSRYDDFSDALYDIVSVEDLLVSAKEDLQLDSESGIPDIMQLVGQLSDDQRLGGDALVAATVLGYKDTDAANEFRADLAAGREYAVEAATGAFETVTNVAKKLDLVDEDFNLIAAVPDEYAAALYGEDYTDRNIIGPDSYKAFRKKQLSMQFTGQRDAIKALGEEEALFRETLGVRTQDEKALYAATSTLVSRQLDLEEQQVMTDYATYGSDYYDMATDEQKAILGGTRDRQEAFRTRVMDSYVESQADTIMQQEAQVKRVDDAKLARASMGVVASYFDPYADDITKGQAEDYLTEGDATERYMFDAASRVAGMGSGANLLKYVAQATAVEDRLKTEDGGAGWQVAEMTGASAHFGEEAMVQNFTDLAMQQYMNNFPTMSTTDFGSYADKETAWEGISEQFADILTPEMIGDIDLSGVESEADLVLEIFETMYGHIVRMGKDASSELSSVVVDVDKLKEAVAGLKAVASYFENYGYGVSSEAASTYLSSTEMGSEVGAGFGLMGQMMGLGSGDAAFQQMIQAALAERRLLTENDGAGWQMARLMGDDDQFGSGYIQNLATLASDRYIEANQLSRTDMGMYSSVEQMWSTVQSDFDKILTPEMIADIDISGIESQAELIEEVFKTMMQHLYGFAQDAAAKIDSEFSNVNLQRNAAGGVEYRPHVQDLPSGFLEALIKMREDRDKDPKNKDAAEVQPVIRIPGRRSGQETEGAYEVDPASGIRVSGSGVWETGGVSYRLTDENQVVVTEQVTRDVEQKRVGDKWYTYINGEWDGNEGEADPDPDQPTGTVRGMIKSYYDMAGNFLKQTEQFEKEPDGSWGKEVTLYEGATPGTDGTGTADSELKEKLREILEALGFTSEEIAELLESALSQGWTREDVLKLAYELMSLKGFTNDQIAAMLDKGVNSGWTVDEVLRLIDILQTQGFTSQQFADLYDKSLNKDWSPEDVLTLLEGMAKLGLSSEDFAALYERSLNSDWSVPDILTLLGALTKLGLTSEDLADVYDTSLNSGWSVADILTLLESLTELGFTSKQFADVYDKLLNSGWEPTEVLSLLSALQDGEFTGEQIASIIDKAITAGWDPVETVALIRDMIDFGFDNTIMTDIILAGILGGWTAEETRENVAALVAADPKFSGTDIAMILHAMAIAGWTVEEVLTASETIGSLGFGPEQIAYMLLGAAKGGWTLEEVVTASEGLDGFGLTAADIAWIIHNGAIKGWTAEEVVEAAETLNTQRFTSEQIARILGSGVYGGWTAEETLKLVKDMQELRTISNADIAQLINYAAFAGWTTAEALEIVKTLEGLDTVTAADMALIMHLAATEGWTSEEVKAYIASVQEGVFTGTDVAFMLIDIVNAGWDPAEALDYAIKLKKEKGFTGSQVGELLAAGAEAMITVEAIINWEQWATENLKLSSEDALTLLQGLFKAEGFSLLTEEDQAYLQGHLKTRIEKEGIDKVDVEAEAAALVKLLLGLNEELSSLNQDDADKARQGLLDALENGVNAVDILAHLDDFIAVILSADITGLTDDQLEGLYSSVIEALKNGLSPAKIQAAIDEFLKVLLKFPEEFSGLNAEEIQIVFDNVLYWTSEGLSEEEVASRTQGLLNMLFFAQGSTGGTGGEYSDEGFGAFTESSSSTGSTTGGMGRAPGNASPLSLYAPGSGHSFETAGVAGREGTGGTGPTAMSSVASSTTTGGSSEGGWGGGFSETQAGIRTIVEAVGALRKELEGGGGVAAKFRELREALTHSADTPLIDLSAITTELEALAKNISDPSSGLAKAFAVDLKAVVDSSLVAYADSFNKWVDEAVVPRIAGEGDSISKAFKEDLKTDFEAFLTVASDNFTKWMDDSIIPKVVGEKDSLKSAFGDELNTAFTDLLSTMKENFTDWMDKDIIPKVVGEKDSLKSAFGTDLNTAFTDLLSTMKDNFTDWIDKDIIPKVIGEKDSLKSAFGTDLNTAFNEMLSTMKDSFVDWMDKDIIPKVIGEKDSLKSAFGTDLNTAFNEMLSTMKDSFGDWIDESIVPKVSGEKESLQSAFTTDFYTAFTDLLTKMSEDFTKWINESIVPKVVGEKESLQSAFVTDFYTAFTDLLTKMSEDFTKWINESIVPKVVGEKESLQSAFVTDFYTAYTDLLTKMSEDFTKWINESIVPKVVGEKESLQSAFVTDFYTAYTKLLTTMSDDFTKWIDESIVPKVVGEKESLQSAFVTDFYTAYTKLLSTMKNDFDKWVNDKIVPKITGEKESIESAFVTDFYTAYTKLLSTMNNDFTKWIDEGLVPKVTGSADSLQSAFIVDFKGEIDALLTTLKTDFTTTINDIIALVNPGLVDAVKAVKTSVVNDLQPALNSASTTMGAIKSAYDAVKDKTITITVHTEYTSSGGGGGGSVTMPPGWDYGDESPPEPPSGDPDPDDDENKKKKSFAGGFAPPTGGGHHVIIGEAGEGEAILPLSKVPQIFADTLRQSPGALKDLAVPLTGDIGLEPVSGGISDMSSGTPDMSSGSPDVTEVDIDTSIISAAVERAAGVAEEIKAGLEAEAMRIGSGSTGESEEGSGGTIVEGTDAIRTTQIEVEAGLKAVAGTIGVAAEDAEGEGGTIVEGTDAIRTTQIEVETGLKAVAGIVGESPEDAEGEGGTIAEGAASIQDKLNEVDAGLTAMVGAVGASSDSEEGESESGTIADGLRDITEKGGQIGAELDSVSAAIGFGGGGESGDESGTIASGIFDITEKEIQIGTELDSVSAAIGFGGDEGESGGASASEAGTIASGIFDITEKEIKIGTELDSVSAAIGFGGSEGGESPSTGEGKSGTVAEGIDAIKEAGESVENSLDSVDRSIGIGERQEGGSSRTISHQMFEVLTRGEETEESLVATIDLIGEATDDNIANKLREILEGGYDANDKILAIIDLLGEAVGGSIADKLAEILKGGHSANDKMMAVIKLIGTVEGLSGELKGAVIAASSAAAELQSRISNVRVPSFNRDSGSSSSRDGGYDGSGGYTENTVVVNPDGTITYSTTGYDREDDQYSSSSQDLYADESGNVYYDEAMNNPASDEAQEAYDQGGGTVVEGRGDDGDDAWRGGFVPATTGGHKFNVGEMGEGEAILPLSKVPQIFADTLKQSPGALKDLAGSFTGDIDLQQMSSGSSGSEGGSIDTSVISDAVEQAVDVARDIKLGLEMEADLIGVSDGGDGADGGDGSSGTVSGQVEDIMASSVTTEKRLWDILELVGEAAYEGDESAGTIAEEMSDIMKGTDDVSTKVRAVVELLGAYEVDEDQQAGSISAKMQEILEGGGETSEKLMEVADLIGEYEGESEGSESAVTISAKMLEILKGGGETSEKLFAVAELIGEREGQGEGEGSSKTISNQMLELLASGEHIEENLRAILELIGEAVGDPSIAVKLAEILEGGYDTHEKILAAAEVIGEAVGDPSIAVKLAEILEGGYDTHEKILAAAELIGESAGGGSISDTLHNILEGGHTANDMMLGVVELLGDIQGLSAELQSAVMAAAGAAAALQSRINAVKVPSSVRGSSSGIPSGSSSSGSTGGGSDDEYDYGDHDGLGGRGNKDEDGNPIFRTMDNDGDFVRTENSDGTITEKTQFDDGRKEHSTTYDDGSKSVTFTDADGNEDTKNYRAHDDDDDDAWQGGFVPSTTGGHKFNIGEMGEGEAILPLSRVPQIFADTLKKVRPSLKDIAAAIDGGAGSFDDMVGSMRGMEMAMVGVTDSHMDSVNSDGDSRIMIENHVKLEVDGEELANMIIHGEEITRRQGRR